MKKIGIWLSLSLLMVLATAVVSYGADFGIEKTTPKDGSSGMAVDNMGVKVFFNQDVYNEKNTKANEEKCKLTDAKGKEIPSKIVFSKKDKHVMLVLADTGDKGVKGKTEYTLTIEKGFLSSDGEALQKKEEVTFKTLDPKATMTVSMVMMGLMVVGMVFFTSREAKKKAEEGVKKKEEKVNPYKVAKETGKSVESVVEKDQKRKAKQKTNQDKVRTNREKQKRHKRENKKEIAPDAFKVKAPKSIASVGVSYQHKKKVSESKKEKNTNPKKKTGKQQNKKKK